MGPRHENRLARAAPLPSPAKPPGSGLWLPTRLGLRAGGHTNAAQLQLTLDLFETNAGQTPRLDKALEMALKRFMDTRARLPKRP